MTNELKNKLKNDLMEKKQLWYKFVYENEDKADTDSEYINWLEEQVIFWYKESKR